MFGRATVVARGWCNVDYMELSTTNESVDRFTYWEEKYGPHLRESNVNTLMYALFGSEWVWNRTKCQLWLTFNTCRRSCDLGTEKLRLILLLGTSRQVVHSKIEKLQSVEGVVWEIPFHWHKVIIICVLRKAFQMLLNLGIDLPHREGHICCLLSAALALIQLSIYSCPYRKIDNFRLWRRRFLQFVSVWTKGLVLCVWWSEGRCGDILHSFPPLWVGSSRRVIHKWNGNV